MYWYSKFGTSYEQYLLIDCYTEYSKTHTKKLIPISDVKISRICFRAMCTYIRCTHEYKS